MATFNGTEGNDTLIGGAAADELNGFGGNDFVQGGEGADTVLGGAGNDTMSGNAGNDWVRGGEGNDSVTGGGGQDSFAFADFGATHADVLTDFASGWDNIQLDLSAFTALGSTGRFVSGDARFRLGTAAQDADDRIVYNQTTGQLWYDADGNGAGAAQLIATLSNRGALNATDIFVFQSSTPPPPPPPAGQAINGTAGDDSLTGGAGNDTINGLGGNDTLNGQAGADQYVLSSPAGNENADVIVGFVSGTDKIVLDASVLTNLGASGNFSAGDARFYSGGWPHDATDRIIYNTTTGELWYDADGTAETASWAGAWPMLIATLEGAPTLAASDFVVINGSSTAGVSRDGTTGNDSMVGTAGDDTLDGGAGNDTLVGLAGNDVLEGGDGSDSMLGGDGNDTLHGGQDHWAEEPAVDTMDGGLGNDTYVLGREIYISPWSDTSAEVVLRDAGGTDTIVARSGYWTLGAGFENLELINGYGEGGTQGIGNELNNVITAHTSWYVYSTLDGGDGNDTLIGGDGQDAFQFQAGSGNYGNDSVVGGGDEDALDFSGARSAVTIDFRSGTATGGGAGGTGSVTFSGIDQAFGGAFNDLLMAPDNIVDHRYDDAWGPLFLGGGGNDTLLGGTEVDFLHGQAGDDEVRGAGGNDVISGGSGNDRLFGDAGDDRFLLQDGYSWWVSAEPIGSDTVDGGAGADEISYVNAASGIRADLAAGLITGGDAGGGGTVRISGVEKLTATDYADYIQGDANANVIGAGGGDDTVFGGGGDDAIHLDGWDAELGYGQDGNDTVIGGSGADRLEGGAGNDSLVAGGGWDTVVGGAGQDTLTGDWGRDSFVLDAAPGAANADLVTDFASGEDRLLLDVIAMPGLGATGSFTAGDARFWTGTAAHDADDRVIFDTATGNLWYDADGSAGGAAQLIATITGTVIATDIAVFNSAVSSSQQIDGTSSSDTLIGGAGNDTINGFDGNDYLDGRGGNDRLDGGWGYDTLYSGAGNDTLLGGSEDDTFRLLGSGSTYGTDLIDGGTGWDTLRLDTPNAASGAVVDLAAGTLIGGGSNATDSATLASIENVHGTAFGDRITGDAASNSLRGLGGADTLAGGAGNDVVDGGDGDDSLLGGDGNDGLYGGAGTDTLQGGLGDDYYEVQPGDVILADAGGHDRVSTNGSWTLSADLEDLYISPTTAGTFSGTGNALDNSIRGADWNTDFDYVLVGLGGNDSLFGGNGDDTLLGGSGADSLSGGWGADSIDGGDGNDTLRGDGRNDTLSGGSGSDRFVFASWLAPENEVRVTDFASAIDRIHLDANAMRALGTGGDFAPNDVRFHAGAAAHDADDRVIYNPATGQLWYDADGTGSGAAQIIATLQPGATLAATDITVDNGGAAGATINGTGGNDWLVGTNANDTISGFGGNDTLDGGPGIDRLVGGDGDDVYYVDSEHDVIIEAENQGNDLVHASTSYELPEWVNNLTLESWAWYGFGNAVDNVITGNATWNDLSGGAGNDTLIGAAGSDNLAGGTGADLFIFNVAPDSDWIADFASGVDRMHLDASAMGGLGTTGLVTAGDGRFYAAAGANAGHDADDRIVYDTTTGELWYDGDGSGSAPAQRIATLQGAPAIAATDIIVVNSRPGVVINGTAGNDFLVGTTGSDTINGFGGSDTIDGGASADSMVGGTGDDVYYVDSAGDVIVELENGGIDEVRASVDHSLFDWVNNLTLLPGTYRGTGNSLENVITGNDWGNSLLGGGGADTIFGWAGSDSLYGDAGNDSMDGGADGDVLYGGAGNDTLQGGTAFDSLYGEDGDDVLDGGVDGGYLIGGNGNDLLQNGQSQDGGDGHDTLIGGSLGEGMVDGAGNDSLVGNDGADTLRDAEGNDTILGGAGDDEVRVGHSWGYEIDYGADFIDGGAGFDMLGIDQWSAVTLDLQAGTLSGGGVNGSGSASVAGIERVSLNWRDYDDFVRAGSGATDIYTGDGDDTLVGGSGADTLHGSLGADTFIFATAPGAADELREFESGTDQLHFDVRAFGALGNGGNFSATDERFYAAAGATSAHDSTDRLIFDTRTGNLYYDADGIGGAASQLVATTTSWDSTPAIVASDIWVDGPTGTTVNGTAGNDSLIGGPGNDTLNGFGGNDTLDGQAGADSMVGGTGDDVYFVDNAGDQVVEVENAGIDEVRSALFQYALPDFVNNLTLLAGAGDGSGNAIDNRIVGNSGANLLWGREGNDTLIGGGVSTGEAADQFIGGSGNDSMVGGASADTFWLLDDTTASYGTDTIIGGDGADEIFAGGPATTGIAVDLAAGTLTGGHAGSSAIISGIERVVGTSFADRMTGNSSANRFDGGNGNDTLSGGLGNDSLAGGNGADTFILAAPPGVANADEIVGFETGLDEIRLDASVMTALGSSGDFTANDARFRAGTQAQDADDRIIFDASSGRLWYDADGSGAGAAQLLATLYNGTAAATDFAVDNGSVTPPPPPPGTNGTEGNDTIVGTAGSDTINGLGGNDFLQGQGSADTVTGGAGNDTIGGNDAADWLEGGAGNDRLSGGSGQDAFVFREFGAANADTLTDFGGNNWDNMRFDNAAFTALGADGRFVSGDARFRAGTAAADADDRVIYNSATAQVWYDADGNGAGAAQLVATLQAGATLVATDIWVI